MEVLLCYIFNGLNSGKVMIRKSKVIMKMKRRKNNKNSNRNSIKVWKESFILLLWITIYMTLENKNPFFWKKLLVTLNKNSNLGNYNTPPPFFKLY